MVAIMLRLGYKDYTFCEILDEMILQMDVAFDYITQRQTKDKQNQEYQWLQAS